jgi:autotransporter-associated beta strand protein
MMSLNSRNRVVRGIVAAIFVSTALTGSHQLFAAPISWSGTGADQNWSTPGNWVGNTPPGIADDVKFTDLGGNGVIGQVDNIVDLTTTNLSLQYASTNGTVFHTTQINPGVTLVLTGSGGLINGNETQNDTRVTNTITGVGGTLIISNTAANINIRQPAGVTAANRVTMDMSGLDTFNATVARLTVGLAGSGTINRATGRLLLARTNVITTSGAAPQTDISDSVGSSNNGSGSTLSLGQTNTLFTDSITIGRGRESASTFNFNSIFTSPGVFIRGTNGLSSRVSNWNIGDAATQTGTITARGTVNLSAGTIDAMVDSMILGEPSLGSGDGSQSVGTVILGAGTLDVNTLLLGNQRTNNNASGVANMSLTGTTLIVNSNIVFARTTGGAGAAVTGGILSLTNAIVYANAINNTAAGTNTLNLQSSTLILTNSAGSAAQPITFLSTADSTFQLSAVAGAPAISVSTLFVNGSSDTINIASAPGVGQFPLIVYTSLGNQLPDFTLGTLPSTFQGYISNNVDSSSVDLVITSSTIKTDTWRGNVNGDWDTATLNWFANGGPSSFAQTDPVVFDDTLTGTPNVNLTTVLTPPSVTVNNSSADYVFSGAGKLSGPTGILKSGDHSLTLNETGGDDFTGGIAANGGTVILDNPNSAISGAFSIGSGATLQIGNNDANGNLPSSGIANNGSFVVNRSDSLILAAPIAGSGNLVKLGTGTLTLNNANTYTGDTAVFQGTLALAGSTSLSNSANIIISNATFDVSGIAGPATTLNVLTLANSTLTLGSTNLATPLNVTVLNFATSGNIINVTALPTFATYPATITLVQSSGGIGGFTPTTGSLPPNFTGSVQISPDTLSIQLTLTSGPTGTRPNVAWSGADVVNLNTNWSDAQNWQLPGAPVAGDNLIFNNNGAQSASALGTPGGGFANFIPDFIDNIVDGNFTLSSLAYTNVGSFFHNTFIKSGNVLSVTNTPFNIGAIDTGASAQGTVVSISGANATLAFNNTNANFQVWNGNGSSSSSANRATLDLSALDTFNASASRILVGANVNQIVNRASGILYLAKTNSLTAVFQTTTSDSGTSTGNSAITVGDANSNAGAESSIVLGLANTISADTINIGREKATGHLSFNPIYANIAPYPSVTFQGFSGSRVNLFEIGNGAGNTGGTTLTADATLTGGFVTANINTLNVGRASSGTSGTGNTTGILNFDAGTINATTVNIGIQPVTGAKVGIGIVDVSTNAILGATANLVAGTINLGLAGGDTGATTTSGTLNITNGIVTANAIVAGTNSISAINVVGGILNVATTMGSASAPLGTLTLASLNTPDNSNTVVELPASATASAFVTTLNYDGLDSTTNRISISSIASVTAPAELPVIQYTSLNAISGGTFNIGLGTLPPGYVGYLTNDTTLSAIALVVTTAPVVSVPPTISHISFSGGNIIISGSNNTGAASTYHLLTSTNLTAPLSTWTVVTNGSFDSSGNLNTTNAIDTTKPQGFYLLQVP